MTERRCTGCGAPLPADVPVGQPIECRFCGLAHDPDAASTANRPPRDSTPGPRFASSPRVSPFRIVGGVLMQRHDFAEVSTLIGYVIPLEREGWIWYLNDPTTPPLPRVRARDGRPIS